MPGPQPSSYVYVIEVDGIVRYVGQGRGYRIKDHLQDAQRDHLKHRKLYANLTVASERGEAIIFRKIIEGLTPEKAWEREAEEIARHPREQLWNMVPGRRPKITDQELIARKSAAGKAVWTPEFHIKIRELRATPEYRAKLSAAASRRSADPVWKENNAKHRAFPRDPEQHRAATRRAMADPALRARLSSAGKTRRRTPTDKMLEDLGRLQRVGAALAASRRTACEACRLRRRRCPHNRTGHYVRS